MMKTILAILLITMTTTQVIAQSKDEQQVTAAMEKFRKAMLDGDAATLKTLTHETLTYGHSSGKLENQQEFVDALATGMSDFKSIDFSNQTVSIVQNTATVRHRLTGDVVDNGVPAAVNLSVLAVWVKIKNQWKLVARQAVKIVS